MSGREAYVIRHLKMYMAVALDLTLFKLKDIWKQQEKNTTIIANTFIFIW